MKLEEIKAELSELSEADLEALQKQIGEILSQKRAKNEETFTGVRLAHAYRPNLEEIKASIRARYTPEERAEMDKVDISKLPAPPRPIWQYISEDREDRF